MHDNLDLGSRIRQPGRRLSKGQRRIAEYLLTQYDKAAFMTASRLGEQVDVSESTVVRFAIALGYDGYPELQKALQEMIRTRLTAAQRIALNSDRDESQIVTSVLRADVANIRQTMEQLDLDVFERAVDAICKARTIYVCGLRSSMPLVELLHYYMNFIFDNLHKVSGGAGDLIEQIARIGAGDVFIGLSFPRYSNRTLQAMQWARNEGATVIAITDSDASPVAEAADLTLTARSDMAAFVDSLVAPMSLLNALLVALGLRNKERLSSYFEKLEQLWAQGHVYVGKERV